MKRQLVILSSVMLFCLSVMSPVSAKEDGIDKARLEAARAMMKSTGATSAFDPVLGLMGGQVIKMMVKQKPEKKDDIQRIMMRVIAEMSVSKAEVLDEVAKVYAGEFTVEEMNKVSAFYQTPVGKKMISKLPAIMQKSMAIGRSWGQRIGADIIRRFKEEAKKQGLEL